MDQVFFSFKRAHHAGLRFTRSVLLEFGLTPARFDMLTAVDAARTQSGVQRLLGLARATISEMLQRLEELGLVRRWKSGRTKTVLLTEEGRDRFRRACDACLHSGDVPVAVDAVLTEFDATVDPTLVRSEIEGLCGLLRRAFGDGATQELYLWHPDEYLDALVSFDEPDALARLTSEDAISP